jgi:putative ABC transport system permease protein
VTGVTRWLAVRSLRHRATAFTATFLAIFLGSALIGSFATLTETGTGPVSDADAESLFIMGLVVGGWGSAIVLFSVASTVGITVTRRATELGLLRTIGGSPRQVRRLVRSETLLVAALASALGAVVAYAGGAGLLALLRGPMVDESVAYGATPASVGIAALGVLAVSMGAAAVAGRRATRGPVRLVLADAAADSSRIRWWRVLAALVLVGYGVVMAVITVTVTADSEDPYAAMQTSGAAAIMVGVGLAALAPLWIRLAAALLPVSRLRAPAHLAGTNARHRSALLATVLAPVIVLTSTATGILLLVGIDGRTLEGAVPEAELITLLNYVVTGMICLFAAIMVGNGIAAMLAHRRPELARLQLVGASGRQVRASLVAEAVLVAVVGVALGLVASTATIVPFAVARDEGVVPDGQLWVAPLVAVAVLALTIGLTRVGARRLPAAIAR